MKCFEKILEPLASTPGVLTAPSKMGNKFTGLIHQEPIRRTEKYSMQFSEWKNSNESLQLLKRLYEKFQAKKLQEVDDLSVTVLETPYANGVLFSYTDAIPIREFEFLFDLLKETAEMGDYRSSVSDRRIIQRSDYTETIEKHYLKPTNDPLPGKGSKMQQLYGNILLEHVLIDGTPSYLKILCTLYSDGNFADPLPFEDFIELLFTGKVNESTH